MAKKQSSTSFTPLLPPEGKGLLILTLVTFALLSLLSYHTGASEKNWLGLVGYGLAFGLNYLFGLPVYLLLGYTGFLGWKILLGKTEKEPLIKHVYFSLFFFSISILLNVMAEHGSRLGPLASSKIYTESFFFDLPYPHETIRYNLGGVPLYYLYRDLPTFNLQRLLSDFGITLTFLITSIVSFLLYTQLDLSFLKPRPKVEPEKTEEILTRHLPKAPYTPIKESEPEPPPPPPTKKQIAIKAQKVYNGDFTDYQLPPPSLLATPKKIDQPTLKKDLKRQAEILEETLLSFGIEAKVGEINCGPTITSFEVHPAIGVKVQKIKTLENDIALNLQAKSIRIIAPIPGKAVVGIEIPSLHPQEVSFKELLLSYQQQPRKQMIPVLLGKTVNGDNVISDLSKMPHLLIAGATGSGKSVCINTLVMSVLMTARPDEIKLLMIDPKKVELTSYATLPHMIAPVITEPHGAYSALNWLVKEMQTRYDILKQLGLRNITAFNNRQINSELEASLTIPVPTRMCAILAIIDEFADLMMVSSSDLETPITRIAQMARAVGIHLVLATQRPSREVITGLIKANFPTRITFKVSNRINSQIVIDESGAENLMGNGDMLGIFPGSSHLIRAQGAFISDEEINRVVSFIADQAPPNYLIPSFDKMAFESTPSEDGEARDSLYEQAKSTVIETQTASTTYLQRKLKIGYARAASLMDELESNGIIGPQEGAKPRRILISNPSSKPQSAYETDQATFE